MTAKGEPNMQMLLVADLHYALKQFDWLLDEAKHYDVVVVAGDLLDVGAMATPEAQIVVLRTYLRRISEITRLVVCSGNHDLDDEQAGERVSGWIRVLEDLNLCVDGHRIVIGDTLISALPWWDGPLTKADIEEQIARDAEARSEQACWVWVHHAPPAESGLSWGGSRSFGDADLRRWIETYRPDFVFSGHVHQAPFISGGTWVEHISGAWCFNTGQQMGPVPAHIAVNLDKGEALWLSQAGPQLVTLEPDAVPEARTTLPDWF